MKRITLLYPHTHAGVAHASGVTLSVPDLVAEWLLDHRIAMLARSQFDVSVPPPLPVANKPAASAAPIADIPAAGAATATTEPTTAIAETANPEIDHDPAS